MKKKTILISLLSIFFAACGSLQPIDIIEGGNEDDFFVKISDIVSKDTGHDYVRVKGDGINPSLLSQIRSAALKTEGTYKIGLMYQTTITANGRDGGPDASYVLFFMDTVVEERQSFSTPGGKQINVELGAKAIKWALYQIKPVPPRLAPQEGLQ